MPTPIGIAPSLNEPDNLIRSRTRREADTDLASALYITACQVTPNTHDCQGQGEAGERADTPCVELGLRDRASHFLLDEARCDRNPLRGKHALDDAGNGLGGVGRSRRGANEQSETPGPRNWAGEK